jgi:hypothetical protein
VKAAAALARRVLRFELGLYRSLARWVARRPRVPAGAAPFAYVGAVAAVLWAFIVVSAIEVVAVHLLLPWETVRLVVDILGLWGLVWMIGMLASLSVHPHLVDGAGLHVRYGAGTSVTVPWEAVASVAARRRSLERSKTLQLAGDEHGTVLNVVVGSQKIGRAHV